MSNHILVCPFNEDSLKKMKGKALVIRTDDFNLIPHIDRVVNDHNKLHCILVIDKKKFLSAVPFREDWKDIPLTFYLGGMGSFKTFLTQLPMLRQSSLRVFFSTDKNRNLQDLTIMSSLGVDCGVWFGDNNNSTDWDALNDLMYYSIYTRTAHGDIEPFYYAVSHYDPQNITDFSSVYFDNPLRYLHMDENENVALTRADLENGNFISRGMDSLDKIEETPGYIKLRNRWEEFFLQTKGCAYCPAWRICLGKFAPYNEESSGCRPFFSDLMDAADHFRSVKQPKRKELCQL
jgi:hypothetical protein